MNQYSSNVTVCAIPKERISHNSVYISKELVNEEHSMKILGFYCKPLKQVSQYTEFLVLLICVVSAKP